MKNKIWDILSKTCYFSFTILYFLKKVVIFTWWSVELFKVKIELTKSPEINPVLTMPHFVEDMVSVFWSFFQDKGSLFSFYNACYLSTALQLHVAYSIVHRSALLTTYLVGYGCVCATCYLLVYLRFFWFQDWCLVYPKRIM